MKCSKCGNEMIQVCDPVTKKYKWVCQQCNKK